MPRAARRLRYSAELMISRKKASTSKLSFCCCMWNKKPLRSGGGGTTEQPFKYDAIGRRVSATDNNTTGTTADDGRPSGNLEEC
jgi:hypothetical protein